MTASPPPFLNPGTVRPSVAALVFAAAIPFVFLHPHYQPSLSAGSVTIDLTDLALAAVAVAALVEGVRHGFGPLQQYLDDPTVEELWINEPGRVFVARRGISELTTTILGEEQVRDLVERMLMSSGRRLDLSQPFVDASLPDGSR